MRFLKSALGAASVIAMVGCSVMNSGSSGSTLPTGGQTQAAPNHVMNWTPINSAGKGFEMPRGGETRPSQSMQRGGNYAGEFRSSVGVYGYSPKPNKNNSGPVCMPPGNHYNVNGISSDEKGNLILPSSSHASGSNTTDWTIGVYQGTAQPQICGGLLGSIPDMTGQPVDATSFNAVTSTIAVSEINFVSKKGELVLCSLASLSCGAPVTSPAITGYSAGVAMDAAGNCWLSTSKRVDNGIPAGFRLVYFAGCTGPGQAATGTGGESSYGGLFMDNAGNIGSFDAFNSNLYVYSGCNPTCNMLGKWHLNGQSFYGRLNGSGGKLAVGDVTNGSCDVYNYSLSNFNMRYSFNAGLSRSRVVESCIFSPFNQRTHGGGPPP